MPVMRRLTRNTAHTDFSADEQRMLTAADVPPSMLAQTSSGERVTHSSALGLVDVYACVRALSDAVSSLPLHVYRRTKDGRERADTPAAELLRRPAESVTSSVLLAHLMKTLALHGEAFLGKYRSPNGTITQLGLLHPERVEVELRAGKPVYTVSDAQGRRSMHTVSDIVHIRGMSDGLRGISPIRQCREALGIAAALEQSAATLFANDATPRGILRLGSSAP